MVRRGVSPSPTQEVLVRSLTATAFGYGTIDGQQHAFLLTPIPEPAALTLATAGGILLLRRKRPARR